VLEAGADEGLVVDDQYPDHAASPRFRARMRCDDW
jgi:hypothetical protein